MKSKKNLIIGAIVVVVLFVGILLLKGGSNGISQPGIEGQSNEQTTDWQRGAGGTTKMTDKIYIDVMTQLAKNTISNPGQSEEELQKETEKILIKYGVSVVEYGTYAQALFEDKVRFASMNEKMQQIMLELMKTGGK